MSGESRLTKGKPHAGGGAEDMSECRFFLIIIDFMLCVRAIECRVLGKDNGAKENINKMYVNACIECR